MPVPVWKPDTPRAIVLATDLGARCDRAIDRALQLASQWNARLVVLTVIEADAGLGPAAVAASAKASNDGVDPRLLAASQVRRDVAASAPDVPVDVLVRDGLAGNQRVGSRIEAVAAETGCSLIVTGTARNEPLGRILLGSTVQWLSRTSRLPVLIVRRRVHGPYARLVVASDFSPSSRRALVTIATLLPDAAPTLFHAFDVPFLGLIDNPRDDTLEQARAAALAAAREFLAEAGRPTLPIRVEHGDPATRLRDHARRDDTDLVVVASPRAQRIVHPADRQRRPADPRSGALRHLAGACAGGAPGRMTCRGCWRDRCRVDPQPAPVDPAPMPPRVNAVGSSKRRNSASAIPVISIATSSTGRPCW